MADLFEAGGLVELRGFVVPAYGRTLTARLLGWARMHSQHLGFVTPPRATTTTSSSTPSGSGVRRADRVTCDARLLVAVLRASGWPEVWLAAARTATRCRVDPDAAHPAQPMEQPSPAQPSRRAVIVDAEGHGMLCRRPAQPWRRVRDVKGAAVALWRANYTGPEPPTR